MAVTKKPAIKKPVANKPAAKKPTGKLPKDFDMSKLKRVGNTNERAAVDQQARSKSSGFSPSKLSASDQALYKKYVAEYGKPSTTWANGKPRNPMAEIRNQMSGGKKK